jgi:hypothetical protein
MVSGEAKLMRSAVSPLVSTRLPPEAAKNDINEFYESYVDIKNRIVFSPKNQKKLSIHRILYDFITSKRFTIVLIAYRVLIIEHEKPASKSSLFNLSR